MRIDSSSGDDGTVLVMAVIFASMLFVAGLSWKYIVPVLAMIPPAAVVLWNFFLDDDKKKPYSCHYSSGTG